MADQFELLSPGSACAAALPLNPVSDEYVLTRLAPLVVAQADGGTQPAVLPPQVLHPKLVEFVTRHRPDLSIGSGGEALVAKWRAATAPSSAKTAPAAAGPAPPSSTTPSALPSLALAVFFPYRQTWSLLGYSRGALLNSISLVPQEETTIEVFTWDRVKRAREEAVSFEEESAQEVAFTDKDSREVLKELTKDSSFTFHAGLNLQIPVAPDTTIGGSVDAETKDSLRDVSRATQQTVNEAVRKASSRMKTSRQTKVTETEETGSETRVTRKLRNPNLCRTLNIDHFEVLATYQVTTTLLLNQARLCVLVNNPVGLLATRAFLLANEGVLRRVLLSRLYAAGFDAARLLAAREHLCEIKCAAPCPCDQPSGTPGSPAVEAARQHVTSIAGTVAGVINAVNAAQPDDLIALGSTCSSAGGEAAWASAKTQFHRWLYARLMDTVAPRWWSACREFAASGADRSPEAAERFLLAANIQPADIFNLILLQIIYFGKALEFVASLAGRPNMNPCAGFVLITNIAFDDAGLDPAIGQLRGAVAAWRAALAAPPPPSEDAGDEEPAPAAAPEFPTRDVARALVDEAALLTHLDANASYYRYALWQALSPGDRAHLLNGVPNLPQFVDNEVLGFVGDKMALPFRLSADSAAREWFEGNVLNNPGLQQDTPQPFTVTLPTPAVTLETRLGQCDACEDFITQHRVLDLQHKTAEVALAQQRAEQQKLETQRYQARLDQKQPMLDSPDPEQGALRVIIEGDQKVVPPPK